jgi:hypothetical protein
MSAMSTGPDVSGNYKVAVLDDKGCSPIVTLSIARSEFKYSDHHKKQRLRD